MEKINNFQKLITIVLTVFLILNSLLVNNISAEGDEEPEQGTEQTTETNNIGNNGVQQQNDNQETPNTLLTAPNDSNNDFVDVDIDRPQEEQFVPFELEPESDPCRAAVTLIIDRSIFYSIISNENIGKIGVRFSDNTVKEFDFLECLDPNRPDNKNIYSVEQNYDLRIWAITQTTMKDVRIIFNNSVIEMFDEKYPDHVNWRINFTEENHTLIDRFLSLVHTNYAQLDYSVKYNIGNTEYTISKEDFDYGNIDGIHGFYHIYHLEND